MNSSPELGDLRVVVACPRDRDGEILIRQFQRLGYRVEHMWPPRSIQTEPIDILVCLIDRKTKEWIADLVNATHAVVIGLADPGDSSIPGIVSDLNPHAVIAKPADSGAITLALTVAMSTARYHRRLLGKIAKLEETLRSMRKVERAKVILMERRHINETAAYTFLRDQAMRRRVPIGVIASVVVDANEVLPDLPD